MSTTFELLPGELNLAFRAGDQLDATLDFDIDMTGYSVSASIVSLIDNATLSAVTATITNAQAGIVTIGLTETQTAALNPGTYRWRLTWTATGSVVRTAVSGLVEVKQ
jgi:hypothetical protein